MKRRFSRQELFELRNQIPIIALAQHVLALPMQRKKGKNRYECPICNGYDTSVNNDHNLLRCFDCNRNFNTIDLTMSCLTLDFVDSADWLQKQQANRLCSKKPSKARVKLPQPVHIGKIFNDVLPTRPAVEEKPDHQHNVEDRVNSLEDKMDQMLNTVADLKQLMITRT